MAIHEQNYVSYDGPLDDTGGWWIFTKTTFQLAWSLKRTKILLFLLWIPVLITLGLVFVEYGIRENFSGMTQAMAGGGAEDSGVGAGAVTFILQMQFFSAALLMMASGCGAIADDLRYRTFQLYFSRPVERWEYILGKFLGIFTLSSLVTVLPALLIGGLRAAYFARTDLAGPMFEQTLVGIGLSVGIALVVSSVVLGLSSLTRRTGYVVLGWIGILFVPMVVAAIVGVASEGSETSNLWHLAGNFWLLSQGLLDSAQPEVPTFVPALILLAVSALAIAGVRWRVHKLEGIA
jgi:ABC-type transport system involved in multi-copper enzyme maturation permease subunit